MRNPRSVFLCSAILIAAIALNACTSSNVPPPASTQTTVPIPFVTLIPTVTRPGTERADLPSATVIEPAATILPTVSIEACSPTDPDALGPFYTPGAPQRSSVGEGYILQGVVRSSVDCSPIPNAQIEVWMAGPDGEYRDEYRATFFTDENGAYSFESHFPPPYSGRPPHHHLLVSASGYETLVTQHYPIQSENQVTFDLVLLPSQ